MVDPPRNCNAENDLIYCSSRCYHQILTPVVQSMYNSQGIDKVSNTVIASYFLLLPPYSKVFLNFSGIIGPALIEYTMSMNILASQQETYNVVIDNQVEVERSCEYSVDRYYLSNMYLILSISSFSSIHIGGEFRSSNLTSVVCPTIQPTMSPSFMPISSETPSISLSMYPSQSRSYQPTAPPSSEVPTTSPSFSGTKPSSLFIPSSGPLGPLVPNNPTYVPSTNPTFGLGYSSSSSPPSVGSHPMFTNAPSLAHSTKASDGSSPSTPPNSDGIPIGALVSIIIASLFVGSCLAGLLYYCWHLPPRGPPYVRSASNIESTIEESEEPPLNIRASPLPAPLLFYPSMRHHRATVAVADPFDEGDVPMAELFHPNEAQSSSHDITISSAIAVVELS